MFISLAMIFATGYLIFGQVFKSSLQTQPAASELGQLKSKLQARAKENQECLSRYEDMVQKGEVDATKLCGPPSPIRVVDPPFHQKLLNAVTQLTHGNQTPLETKESS